MKTDKKLLFIHNSFPAPGASGNVVFLRHFTNLGLDWQIHIAVPERLKHKAPKYPSNFYLHFIPDRKWFWPPFREKSSFLRRVRHLIIKNEIDSIIKKIGETNAIVCALSNYMAVAAIEYAHSHSIRSVVFLHDRWDLQNKNTDSELITVRHTEGKKVLDKASVILTVTKELAMFYGPSYAERAILLYPISIGSSEKSHWQYRFSDKVVVVHTGTIDTFAVPVFEHFAAHILGAQDRLELVYVWMDFLDNLLKKYPEKVNIVQFFEKNEEAVFYVAENASAMLVYYGLSNEENMFAMDSFPSRFVEFAQTGVPIICIAPPESAFYSFLKRERYSLLYNNDNFDELNELTLKLRDKILWEQFSRETLAIANKYFLAEELQNIFEKALTKINN